MQLKRKRRRHLRRTLLASSCALLGTTSGALADNGDWSFDTGVLYYSEVGRVRAVEPAAIVKRDLGDDSYLSTRLVVDTLSGATPTGAMPSNATSTTVTSASGVTSTTSAPGVNPMDGNFHDFRKAVSLTWSQALSRLWRMDLGGEYSIEHDFKSQGVSLLLAGDFNERNTTLSAGFASEWDLVFPIGGVHAPLSTLPQPAPVSTGGGGEPPEGPGPGRVLTFADDTGGSEGGGGGGGGTTGVNPPIAAGEHKYVRDLLLGVTQVMTRTWITQLNYSYSRATGYQNDPYNVVSVLNTHLPAAGVIGGPPIGEPVGEIYENRPSLHQKRAVYLGNKVYFSGDVLDFSYRYGWDDWGIRSNTFEARYRIAFGDDFYVMPHLRYYHQSAADFYRRGLLDTDPVPAYVSADYRLAEFSARTFGVEFGMQTSGGGRVSMRLERYLQSGKTDQHVNIGIQQAYDLYPGLTANIAQISVSF